MKKWIATLVLFLGFIPLRAAEIKKNSFQSPVDSVWYCVYCGSMNDDKHVKCRNWDCPTNQSVE
jgi:hypothetical protein